MAHINEYVAPTERFGRRGLLGFGSVLLFVGWTGTALFLRVPTAAPADPVVSSLGLWVGLFVLVATVALTQCPRRVTFSRPILVWVALNTLGFGYVAGALAGLVPTAYARFAYWHVWVGAGVLGFLATGELLRRAGVLTPVYYVAAVVELWILIVGLVSFETLVPGLYLLLAVVHPMPLALDALDPDVGDWLVSVAQVSVYTVALFGVILT